MDHKTAKLQKIMKLKEEQKLTIESRRRLEMGSESDGREKGIGDLGHKPVWGL